MAGVSKRSLKMVFLERTSWIPPSRDGRQRECHVCKENDANEVTESEEAVPSGKSLFNLPTPQRPEWYLCLAGGGLAMRTHSCGTLEAQSEWQLSLLQRQLLLNIY